MTVLDVLPFLSALGIIYTVTDGAYLSVLQFPARVTLVKGTNLTIYCSIPLFDPNALVDVYWRRAGQDRALDPTADNRKRMIPFKQGSAELHLLNVSFQDSGTYYCSVRGSSGKMSNGNGTELRVHVPPTPVKITRLPFPSLTLLCTTADFFPEEFNLIWYQNGTEITSGINTTGRRNEVGLYQVSSSFSPVENWSVYTCQVSHVSLRAGAYDSYTVRDPGDGTFPYPLVFGCTAGVLMLLVLIILVKRCKLDRTEGTEICEDISGHFEEQTVRGGEAGNRFYAALNFSEHRKTGKPRYTEERSAYSQTKQGTDAKLTYACLDLSASQKTGRRKLEETRAEYADICINKPSGQSGIAQLPPNEQ